MENMENIREMSAIGSRIDNSDVNPIRRSTSLNVNEESMVSRLSSDNFKIGPSSHPPVTPLTNNKWHYKDSQGEVQGPFLTTLMAEWYSLGYFHDKMLMVKRACDEHFYSLGDLVQLKGNVPFSDTPFSEQDVKSSAHIRVQPTPTHKPLIMNESLVLQQQQLQHYIQYRQTFLKQRELAIQSAVHQFSQCEKWNTMSPLEQHELLMNHMRNVEANTPMYTAPIVPQPQHQPNIHPMNPPTNNNSMETLSHMQQQQEQQQQQQQQQQQLQHFNHQIDPKYNMHSASPVNAPHHNQSLGSGEEKKKEKVCGFKEHEKKLKEDAERKKLEVELKRLEHEKKMKEVEEKRLQEEEKKREAELKKKGEQKEKKEQKNKENLKQKKDGTKQNNCKSSAVLIVTESQKKKKKEPQTVSNNGVESASSPWATMGKKKQVQVKSMAEIQAEQKREQLIKQNEREHTERKILAIEQAKQEKARSAVKMQTWSTVVTKNVPHSTLVPNNSVSRSTNQNTDKQQIQKSNKIPVVTVNNNKNNVKSMTKLVNQTVQQTNAMKKAIVSRGENNKCNDELSQWCCKHLAKLNMNTIDK